ncbi:PE-PGRS family protein [Mycobacterium tuberculosis]|nr:PE-PGRS family protein [Mycobacterium tuberculosis]
MSFVNVAPQLVSTAAADAARIGSAINTANTAAAATTQVLAAAQDEVSTASPRCSAATASTIKRSARRSRPISNGSCWP